MTTGLVLGKFMPLHRGHLALIEFAAQRSDELIVLLGALKDEPIEAVHRLQWLWQTFQNRSNVRIEATVEPLPASGRSSRDVSRVWAEYLLKRFPTINCLFTSEPYGDELAEFMQIRHVPFDPPRSLNPISATQIRLDPHRHWEDLSPAARPYFLKRICLFGPECTGKSTLARQLAEHYRSVYVEEKARELIDREGLSPDVFPQILAAQAHAVLEAERSARAFVFCDTDAATTKLYYRFFYGQPLTVPPWIEAVHTYDHYLFCDVDLPWHQENQRFFAEKRAEHRRIFLDELDKRGELYTVVSGTGKQRFDSAVEAVEKCKPFRGKTRV